MTMMVLNNRKISANKPCLFRVSYTKKKINMINQKIIICHPTTIFTHNSNINPKLAKHHSNYQLDQGHRSKVKHLNQGDHEPLRKL